MVILGGLGVLALWILFLMLGYEATFAFRIPLKPGFPFSLRLVGLLVILSSLGLFAWLIRYRRPVEVLTSTYVTFSKMVRKTRLEERSIRTEPLVVEGPYRYVRHPLYTGVVLLAFGSWIMLDYNPLLVTTILFLLWFNFVVIPFEEKELKAIFGREYEDYSKKVARIVPMPERSKDE
jgi:hypothetical protein